MPKRKAAKPKKRKKFQAYLGAGVDREKLTNNERESIADLEEFMGLAHKRWDQGEEANREQLARENEALRFAAGEEWPEDLQAMRAGMDAANGLPAVPAKPCLALRSILDPINQLNGDAEDSDLGFELIPADDFEELIGPIDDTEIKLREGLVRRIQRNSDASDARLWGFDRGMKCGRGYWGVMTRYVEGKSNDQEVYVDRFYNQNGIILDPAHEKPDGSDAEWGFGGSDHVPWDDYEDLYPDAYDGSPNAILDTDDDDFTALGDEVPGWYTVEEGVRYCRVANYYYTIKTPKKLATLADGSVEWEKDLPDGVTPVSVRTVMDKQVMWAKIDGKNKLQETKWPSPYIPIVKYIARELQPYDDQHRYEGIVQPAIDAARGEDYMVSQLVWQIGLAPVPQIMMAGGQDEGFEKEYLLAPTRALPVLHYNQTDLYGRPAPPPFKTPTNTEIGPIATAVGMFKQAFQAATESHGPSHGESDPALRSGKAINAVVANDKHGSSNYITNWARSISYEAKIINSLLYPIYGTKPGRIARIVDPSNNQESVMIGQHFTMQGAGKMARPVKADPNAPNAKKYQLTKDAKFNCVVTVTKKYQTIRQEEAAMLGQVIAASPEQMMPVYGDIWFKHQDGPGHEELAERAKLMLAPQVQQGIAAKAQGLDIPPPVQAHIAQLTQEKQQVVQLLQKAQMLLNNESIKRDTELQRTKMDNDNAIELAHINNAAKIEAARISAAKQTADPGAEAQEELLATGIQHAQENFASEADHQRELQKMQAQHALDMAASAQDHAQTMQQGDQAHQQALAQGEQANSAAMQQNEQQAALAPQPETNGGDPNV